MRHGPAALMLACCAFAGDWPEWRGRGRTGEWRETGILDSIPEGGLRVAWRAPVRGGYAGPAVAGGRVFVTDYAAGEEHALAFDEQTGRLLWTAAWPANYRGLDYASGPRATPTVDGDRVYVLGAAGDLLCLATATGAVHWRKNFRADFHSEIPGWGSTNAPLVDGGRLIVVAGGRPDGKVVALDKRTGRELWRALSSEESEPGYSQPVIFEHSGARRLFIFHAGGLTAMNPETGKVLWEHAYRITFNTPIATPVAAGPFVLVSSFFQGARLLRQDSGELIWRGKSESEQNSDTIHALMASPVVDGDYVYGICNYGQLRCLRLGTGERVWESQAVTVEKARNVSAFVVRNGDRYFFNNDRGELVIARLSPGGYTELARTRIIKPTSKPGSRRELGAVNWVHPAYANGHLVTRNDEEIVRLRLMPGVTGALREIGSAIPSPPTPASRSRPRKR